MLIVVATYPMVDFFSRAPIGGGDSGQNSWNLWWMGWAIAHQESPFYTNMLYYPEGVSLAYHALSPLNGIFGIFLKGMQFNLPATFNSLAWMTFWGTAGGTYFLARSLSQTRTAAFVAGIVFVFAPIRMSRVLFGNLEMYSTQFIPFMVWFALRLTQTGRWRDALGVAGMFTLTAWSSLELALGSGVLLGLLFLFGIFSTKQKVSYLLRWVGIMVGVGVSVLPLVLPMLQNADDFRAEFSQREAAISNSADLLGFVVLDNVTNPFVKRIAPDRIAQTVARVYDSFLGNRAEKTVFVGYTVLFVILLTVFYFRAPVGLRWGIIAAVFGVLSLGPVLHIAGRTISIPMPYEIFLHLPLLRSGRTPSRLDMYVMFALAIVVGLGLTQLERHHFWHRGFTLALGGLIFIEFWVAPVRSDVRFSNVPDFYYQLAQKNDDGAILDIPIDLYGAQGPAESYMIYQTVHQHPMVGGYISRTPEKVLSLFDNPFLYELRARIYGDTEPYRFPPEILASGRNEILEIGVAYIILHKNVLSLRDSRAIQAELTALFSVPWYEDDVITVWMIHNDP